MLSGSAVLALAAVAIHRRHDLVFALTLLGFTAAGVSVVLVWPLVETRQAVTTLLVVDRFALYYTALTAVAGFLITLLSYGYWERRGGLREEYYLLLLLGSVGGMVLASSTHFATLFLGLEIMSITIYVMVAYERSSRLGLEAGLKYLVLSGVSSAFILFGIALIYTDLGSMWLAEVILRVIERGPQPIFLAGAAMVLVGLSFKLALFPFFLWAPDVFEGAPATVTAFLATISKGAVFAVLVRFFLPLQAIATIPFLVVFTFLAIATMFAGNLLALRQLNLKRLLAYSSVAHMGYLLIPLIARSSLGVLAITFYLTTYFVTTLGAFGVITLLSDRDRDMNRIEDYRGMAWRHPWLAGVLTACLLSLAGLPITAGFMGKFFVVLAGVGAAAGVVEPAVMRPTLWTLLIVLVVNSGLSLYYYLRVVRELFRRPDAARLFPAPALSLPGSFALVVLALLLLWLGVYPSPILRVIEATVTAFTP
jgi:NADH-quinone oxidoreductase subunit N